MNARRFCSEAGEIGFYGVSPSPYVSLVYAGCMTSIIGEDVEIIHCIPLINCVNTEFNVGLTRMSIRKLNYLIDRYEFLLKDAGVWDEHLPPWEILPLLVGLGLQLGPECFDFDEVLHMIN